MSVSRWATVFLFLASIFVTWQLDTVAGAWQLLLALGSGTGLVLILRWYWWRINAWSEISAMIASFVVSLIALSMVKSRMPADSPLIQTYVMLITVAVSTVVWLSVTFLTKPEPDEQARVVLRAGAARRARLAHGSPSRLGYGGETIPGGALAWTNWLAGIIAVYSTPVRHRQAHLRRDDDRDHHAGRRDAGLPVDRAGLPGGGRRAAGADVMWRPTEASVILSAAEDLLPNHLRG